MIIKATYNSKLQEPENFLELKKTHTHTRVNLMVQFDPTFPRSHKHRLASETPRANNRGSLELQSKGQYLKSNAVLCAVVSDSL